MKLLNFKKSLLLVLFVLPGIAFAPITDYSIHYCKRPPVKTVNIIKTKKIETIKPGLHDLIGAMIIVESDGRDSIIGDKHLGKNYAVGALQIRPVMVREVNRILKLQHKKKKYTLNDRFSRQKSIEMFNIWREFHHPNDDFEKIARNWNGGPRGYLKNRTVEYWVEVQLELNK